jgi:ankyrin repeat protein
MTGKSTTINVPIMLFLLTFELFPRVRIDDFYKAIDDGDIELVKKQCKNGADVNFYYREVTPLGRSIQKDDIPIATLLLDANADPNRTGKNKTLPLLLCTSGEMVDLLVAHGADINVNANRRTYTPPIFHAINKGNTDVVSAMIRNGADLTCRNSRGETPYLFAEREKLYTMAALLKSAGGYDATSPDAKEYHTLNDIDYRTKKTPLETAIFHNDIEEVKSLLDRGADIRMRGKYGESVERRVIEKENIPILEVLLQHGVDKNHALRTAVWKQKDDVVKYLLSIDTDPNFDSGNATPLVSVAISQWDTGLTTILLKNGADVNGIDSNGNTPLSLLLQNRHEYPMPWLAEYLLKNGADIHRKNNIGKSPLNYAAQARHVYGVAIYRMMQKYNTGKKVTSGLLIGVLPLFLVYFVFMRKSSFNLNRMRI